MTDDQQSLERRLAAGAIGTPRELRAVVLASVRRELVASRWDRRLGRVAVAALAAGVGLNALVALPKRMPNIPRDGHFAQPALVGAAVAVAEATDAETGRQYVRQLARWSGLRLTSEQAAAIDAAISQSDSLPVHGTDGKDG